MLNPKDDARLQDAARLLCDWFATHQRDMPWRRDPAPYRVWISEIMLQQTQTATVIPYFERFMARFPNVQALAGADLGEVLKLWAGLGYYSRARNLHKGAKAIVADFGGQVPRTRVEILRVPGIGEYTAGAVLSIAHNLPEALVDGNVARVFSRLLLLNEDHRTPAGRRVYWQLAGDWVRAAACGGCQPRDFNQALMELGATVCLPSSPKCLLCPLRDCCAASATSRQAEFPRPAVRKASPVWHLRAWLLRDGEGRVLLARREAKGLFGGLWELPTEKLSAREWQAARKVAVAEVRHVLTHRVLEIVACRPNEKEASPFVDALLEAARTVVPAEGMACWSGRYEALAWVSLSDIVGEAKGSGWALGSAHSKLINLAKQAVSG